MNFSSRHRLGAALLMGCLFVVAGRVHSQTVEDSIDVGGAWVSSLAYNSRGDTVLEVNARSSR